jgi:hypothetical protein
VLDQMHSDGCDAIIAGHTHGGQLSSPTATSTDHAPPACMDGLGHGLMSWVVPTPPGYRLVRGWEPPHTRRSGSRAVPKPPLSPWSPDPSRKGNLPVRYGVSYCLTRKIPSRFTVCAPLITFP